MPISSNKDANFEWKERRLVTSRKGKKKKKKNPLNQVLGIRSFRIVTVFYHVFFFLPNFNYCF
jgi:hypothetical protein